MNEIKEEKIEEKKEDNRYVNTYENNLLKISESLERLNVSDYIFMLKNPWKLFWYNFIAGTARGLGILVGATLVLSILYQFLKNMVNIPIIGHYVVEIINFVQLNMGKKP